MLPQKYRGHLPPPSLLPGPLTVKSEAAFVMINPANLRLWAPPNALRGKACFYLLSGETLRPRELVWLRALSRPQPVSLKIACGPWVGRQRERWGEQALGSSSTRLAWKCSAPRWAWPGKTCKLYANTLGRLQAAPPGWESECGPQPWVSGGAGVPG